MHLVFQVMVQKQWLEIQEVRWLSFWRQSTKTIIIFGIYVLEELILMNYFKIEVCGQPCIQWCFIVNHEFFFRDHQAPNPFELIEKCCKSIHDWLSKDPKNVAVIHCKAGKVIWLLCENVYNCCRVEQVSLLVVIWFTLASKRMHKKRWIFMQFREHMILKV